MEISPSLIRSYSLLEKPALTETSSDENTDSNSQKVQTVLESFPLSPSGGIRRLVSIRKRHLDRATAFGVTGSPYKKKFVKLDKTSPIVQRVIAEMKKQGSTTGRNAALIFAHDPETKQDVYTIAITKGPPSSNKHAEKLAYDLLPDRLKTDTKLIKMVYTLRAPCQHGCNCHHSLKLVTSRKTQIAYTVECPKNPAERKKCEQQIRALLEDEGVRSAAAPTGGIKRKEPDSKVEVNPVRKKLKFDHIDKK